AGDTAITGIIATGANTITKDGTGTLTLSGVNTYSGGTTISAGVVSATTSAEALGTGAITVADGAALQVTGALDFDEALTISGTGITAGGALRNISGDTNWSGVVTLGADARINSDADTLTLSGATIDEAFDITIGGAGDTAITGIIATGANTITKDGTGTLTLSGVNTYSGGTTISAGTLQVGDNDALGAGAVNNDATLNIGIYTVDIGAGVYTQGSGSSLQLTANSSTEYGSIVSTGDAADAAAASTVDVTVGGYIPHSTVLTVLNTGAGSTVDDTLITTTSTSSKIAFTPSMLGGKLILTANRSATGFSSNGTDSNAKAIGNVLDNVTDPTADMTTMLDTLEGLSASGVNTSLQTLEPSVDAGIIGASNLAVGQFIQTIISRFGVDRGPSGVATGDPNIKTKDIWAKGFGTYAKQDKRKGIDGYRADVIGAAVGVDFVATEKSTFGISTGYAYSKVKPKKTSLGKTEADSIQGSLYYSYNNELNYIGKDALYFDLIGSFAWNMYEGKRNISVGSTDRQAKSDYDGQQYTAYAESGYYIPSGNIDFVPLASLQYTRLEIDRYTENGADSLNLTVNKQHYDLLELGLGVKVSSIMRNEGYDVVPSVRGKWLYDFIGDKMETTSRFTGGGASFATTGAKPAKSSFDIGASLTFLGKNNVKVDFDYDFNFRDDFNSHNGAITVKYSF
ncbi:MAG: autotransporter domain-containing protein, partial [Candidatus Omnitrophota bacterium]